MNSHFILMSWRRVWSPGGEERCEPTQRAETTTILAAERAAKVARREVRIRRTLPSEPAPHPV